MSKVSDSTPVKDKAQSTFRFIATLHLSEKYRLQYTNETQGMFFGPMPVEEFLDRYVSLAASSDEIADEVNQADFSNVPTNDGVLEKDMYLPLIQRFNEHCGRFQFQISASKSGNDVKIRPDIGMIDPSRWSLAGPLAANAPLGDTAIYDWSRCEMSCEVKRSSNDDAFEDEAKITTFEKLTDGGTSNRGQLITYFKEQAARQHRTFVFQIFIFGTFARLLRWDRSGAVVTRKFNYKEEPQLLAKFLWRYSQLPGSEERGWDPSFTLAALGDAELFKTEMEKILRGEEPIMSSPGASRTVFRAMQAANAKETLEGDYPTYTVHLSPSTNWDLETTLVIRRPIYIPLSPFGRATRGYFAYDKGNKEFRFFKDGWRIDHRYIEAAPADGEDDSSEEDGPIRQYRSEDEFYTLMNGLDIPRTGLPRVYYAGDVKNTDGTVQKTQTNELPLDDPDVNKWRKAVVGFGAHIHHHVLQEILCPLELFSCSRELVGITLDVLQTMKMVQDHAKILHRDLSAGNIMFRINDEGKVEGVLNDWDNNGPDSSIKRKVGVYRTGTWQFMAIPLLQGTGTRHQLGHDLESVVLWVLLYTALRYLQHSESRRFNMGMFDYVDLPPTPPDSDVHYARGGELKLGFLWKQYHLKSLRFACEPLDKLLQKIHRDYYKYYNFSGHPTADLDDDPDERAIFAVHQACVRRLNDVNYFIKLFKNAYDDIAQWPEADKTEDQFPPCTQVKGDKDRRTAISASIHASDSGLHPREPANAAAELDASAGPSVVHVGVGSNSALPGTASAEFPPLLTNDGKSEASRLSFPSLPIAGSSLTAQKDAQVPTTTKRKATTSEDEDADSNRSNKKNRKENL